MTRRKLAILVPSQPPTVEVRRPYVVDDCTGRKGCPAPAHLRGCHSVTEVSP